jgi:hypothetical protein
MNRLSAGAGAVTLAAALVSASPRAEAPGADALVETTVEGVLEKVATHEEGVVVRTDDGQLMGWRLPEATVAEAAKFAAGTRVFVIYRGVAPEERAVTALGFPGAAGPVLFVNGTGYDVFLRATTAIDGQCGAAKALTVAERELPIGGTLHVPGACWCCAPRGGSCTASSRARPGSIVLAQCFGAPAR